MPTENRSSNTQMAAQLSPCPHCGQQDAFVEQLDSDASVVICQGRVGEHSACLARGPVGVQQHDCESQPGHDQAVKEWNKRAAQSHPEPIAWMVGTTIWWTKKEAERDAAATGMPIVGLGAMTGAAPAEQHQGEPVAYAVFTDNGNIRIWSTNCAAVAIKVMREEGKQVVPLYAHSAPSATAEVERLREELDAYEHGSSVEAAEADSLRKQLAEAHALLREAYEDGFRDGDRCHERGDHFGEAMESGWLASDACKALSASAEPSAPAEIDERADFERHVILTTGRPIDSELKRHPVRHDEYECRTMQTRWNDWQARAALDRKPS